ncbi:MAG: BON domain-containing protein [Steroidobacteraceae bacterium]
MVWRRHYQTGPLLAGTLGVAAFGILSSTMALCGPPSSDLREITVTASKLSDAETTEKVVTALREDRYIFGDHVAVTTEHGVVRLEGIVSDLGDLFQMLRLARRIAGKGRVINALRYVPTDDDSD